MTNAVTILSEPELEFRYGQRLLQPQDGLGLFGPYDTDASSHPGTGCSVRYSIRSVRPGLWSAVADPGLLVGTESSGERSRTTRQRCMAVRWDR